MVVTVTPSSMNIFVKILAIVVFPELVQPAIARTRPTEGKPFEMWLLSAAPHGTPFVNDITQHKHLSSMKPKSYSLRRYPQTGMISNAAELRTRKNTAVEKKKRRTEATITYDMWMSQSS